MAVNNAIHDKAQATFDKAEATDLDHREQRVGAYRAFERPC